MIPGNINTDLISGADEVGYQVTRSLRFNSADSAYLSRTPASAGNRKTWTWAGWVKLSALTGTNSSGGGTLFHCRNGTGDDGITDFLINTDGTVVFTGGASTWLTTTQVLRDFSAWYHLVMSVDTTAATASNRLRLYINGSQVTTFNVNVSPTQNSDLAISQAATHRIGGRPSFSQFFNGYLADVHFIDGQALTPSSFAETNATTGQWVPKAYTGTFGTNGFWLKFSDNSAATATTLGKDYSGNSNNWTPNNLSVTAGAGNDSLVDTPTSYGTDTGAGGSVRGNYCTLNPLKKSANITLANGNLDVSTTPTSGSVHSTIGVSSGKWYWECTLISGTNFMCGIAKGEASLAEYTGQNANGWSYYSSNGNKYNNSNPASYGATFASGDVIGVALDADNGTLTFYKNGVSQGQAYSGLTSGPYFASCSDAGGGSSANSAVYNFGQRQWAYAAPAGFKALVDTNLPAPVVAKPNTVMDVKLYTGNGSTQTISGLGFSPDLVWNKNRSGANSHSLFDTIRGATKQLNSNLADAESTDVDKLTAFTSDGFTVGNSPGVNASGNSYVAWAWDAGSSTVTNTQGSITSSCRTNQSSGFSIVSWTSNAANAIETMGHGLGVAPELIIVKNRDTSTGDQWPVYHKAFTSANNYLMLNSTNAVATAGQSQWSTSSTTFGLRQSAWSTANTQKMIAYCFAPVAGYSSFGSYTGNGSADGPFVYTGFRPRWVMIKNSTSDGGGNSSWLLVDTARGDYNVVNPFLLANTSAAEGSVGYLDILSNGFKLRATGDRVNASATYIYAAFAENPFQYARAR